MSMVSKPNPNIVVIGGGTGSFMLLSELKHYSKNITAIVNMADDGGSTGVLRDELGVLPPGDIRQCLVALSDASELRDLFNYRFSEGSLDGHSFGNLFLTALEKTTGSFTTAVETAAEILHIDGQVIPATLDNVRLQMKWDDETATLSGERVIDAEHFKLDPKKAELSLLPRPQVNPSAITAIAAADIVVVAPGDLYTSLGPLLVIDGIGEALAASSANMIYVCNLVTKQGQTNGFSVEDHVNEIERFAGTPFLDAVIYNTGRPATELVKLYEDEAAVIVERDMSTKTDVDIEWLGDDFLGDPSAKEKTGKLTIARSLIRHNGEKIAKTILKLYNSNNES